MNTRRWRRRINKKKKYINVASPNTWFLWNVMFFIQINARISRLYYLTAGCPGHMRKKRKTSLHCVLPSGPVWQLLCINWKMGQSASPVFENDFGSSFIALIWYVMWILRTALLMGWSFMAVWNKSCLSLLEEACLEAYHFFIRNIPKIQINYKKKIQK